MVLNALREKGTGVSVGEGGGCLEQNRASRRQRKIEKAAVGPGPRECKAGHEPNNFGELRVRWGGLCALGNGGAEHGRAR